MPDWRKIARLEAQAQRAAARMLRESARPLLDIARAAMSQAGRQGAILPPAPFDSLAETLTRGKVDTWVAIADSGGEFDFPKARPMIDLPGDRLRTLDLFGQSQAQVETARMHLLDTLGRAMGESVARGDHVRAGKAAVAEALQAAGFDPSQPHTLEAVYRTATMEANTAARVHAARANDLVWDQLWGWEYTAVGDERTRPEHQAMNGMRLPKDHPFWRENMPPNGWNCRCTVMEVFRDEAPDSYPEPPALVTVEGQRVEPHADDGWRFNPADNPAYHELAMLLAGVS